jgi:hypothetical protein
VEVLCRRRWLCACHRRRCVPQPPRRPPTLPYYLSPLAPDVRAWERGAPLLLAPPILAAPPFWLPPIVAPLLLAPPMLAAAAARGGAKRHAPPFFLRSLLMVAGITARGWAADAPPSLRSWGAAGAGGVGIQTPRPPLPISPSAPLPTRRRRQKFLPTGRR